MNGEEGGWKSGYNKCLCLLVVPAVVDDGNAVDSAVDGSGKLSTGVVVGVVHTEVEAAVT